MSHTITIGTGACRIAEPFASECLFVDEYPHNAQKHWQSQWHTASIFIDSANQPNHR